MGNLFGPLLAKILAGVTAVLLVGLVFTGLQLRWARATIEEQRNAIAGCEAARRVQNAAIAAAEAEGRRQREAFATALQAGQDAMREAQGRVTIVRQTAPNGCATPRQVMEAGL